MHHHTLSNYRAGLLSRFGDLRLLLTLGVLIMAFGLWDCLGGGSTLNDAVREQEQTIGAMSFLCGLYLLLTGLWIATRNALTLKRALGLAVMLAGILGGTWIGIRLTAPNRDDFTPAYVAFFVGLFIHLLGVLYVRKE